MKHLETNRTNGWKKGSIIWQSPDNGSGKYGNGISINYETSTAETYVDGVLMVDLTETFGAGNEPDKEWCDKNIDYFDGTQKIYK